MDDDMILSEEQIGELLSCQEEGCEDDKLEKIKCNNCGRIHKVPCPNTNFNYCSACGTKFEIEPERDPWLWEGCICEVWDDTNEAALLRYYSKKNKLGKPEFVNMKNNVGNIGCCYDNYRPLGTPLGFAPGWATHIKFIFNEDNIGFKFIELSSYLKYAIRWSDWLPWRDCPEHLFNTILPIPDWARNGGTE